MIWVWLSGFFFGLFLAVLAWYPYKEKADILSRHCETLQYCLDICSDCVEELQSQVKATKDEPSREA